MLIKLSGTASKRDQMCQISADVDVSHEITWVYTTIYDQNQTGVRLCILR